MLYGISFFARPCYGDCRRYKNILLDNSNTDHAFSMGSSIYVSHDNWIKKKNKKGRFICYVFPQRRHQSAHNIKYNRSQFHLPTRNAYCIVCGSDSLWSTYNEYQPDDLHCLRLPICRGGQLMRSFKTTSNSRDQRTERNTTWSTTLVLISLNKGQLDHDLQIQHALIRTEL